MDKHERRRQRKRAERRRRDRKPNYAGIDVVGWSTILDAREKFSLRNRGGVVSR